MRHVMLIVPRRTEEIIMEIIIESTLILQKHSEYNKNSAPKQIGERIWMLWKGGVFGLPAWVEGEVVGFKDGECEVILYPAGRDINGKDYIYNYFSPITQKYHGIYEFDTNILFNREELRLQWEKEIATAEQEFLYSKKWSEDALKAINTEVDYSPKCTCEHSI